MNLTNQEAHELVEAIHEKLDRTEWDSDTPVEIAEVLEAYGLEVRPPRKLIEWTAGGMDYLAEVIDDDTRIAVWVDRDNAHLTGVQYIRQSMSIESDDRTGSFLLKGLYGYSLEQRLDAGIEHYRRIRL